MSFHGTPEIQKRGLAVFPSVFVPGLSIKAFVTEVLRFYAHDTNLQSFSGMENKSTVNVRISALLQISAPFELAPT